MKDNTETNLVLMDPVVIANVARQIQEIGIVAFHPDQRPQKQTIESVEKTLIFLGNQLTDELRRSGSAIH